MKDGSELRLTSPVGQYALSCDGQTLAYVDKFPRLCVKTWSFATASIVLPRVDLVTTRGEPRLIGFSAANRLLVRWLTPEQVIADSASKAQPWTIEPIAAPGVANMPSDQGEKLAHGPKNEMVCTA